MRWRAITSSGTVLLCVCCNAIFGIEEPQHRPEGSAGSSVAGKSGTGGSPQGGKGGKGGTGAEAGAGVGGALGGSAGDGASGAAGGGDVGAGGTAGAATGGSAGDAGSPALGVEITAPARTVHTNGTVHFEIVVEGEPDTLDLLVNGKTQKHLGAARTYDWNTTAADEDTYRVTVRATFGTQTLESAPRTIYVDRTAPKLSKRVPGPNAPDVFIDDPISARFSEALDPDTVSSGSVKLTVDGNALPADATLSDAGRLITLAPAGKIVAPGTLEVTLTTALRDLAGNQLGADEVWSWELPEWAQIGNVTGSPGTVVNECFLALGADGYPAVVLSDQEGTGALVQRWDGSAWSQVGDSINVNAGQAVAVAYLVDVAGTLTVALKESDGTLVNGYVVEWNGTSWVPLGGAINPLGTSDIQDALPATNTHGDLVVGVWQGDTGAAPFHGFLQRWTGSGWQALGGGYNAVAGGSIHLKPAVGLDEAGQPYMVWGEKESANYDDYVVTYADPLGWQTVGGKVNPEPGLNMGGQGLLAISKKTGLPFTAMRSDDDVPPAAYAMHWDGLAWNTIGGAINPVPGQTVTYGTKAFALTADDIPILAVVENNGVVEENAGAGTNNAYVVKWDGDQWQTLGGGVNPIPGQNINRLRMTLDRKDRPVISMLDSNEINNFCYVYRSNN